jgi:hypothetical protein
VDTAQVVGFLLFALLIIPTSAAADLPKYAYTVPPGQVLNLERCDVKNTLAVMPAVQFRLSDDPSGARFAAQTEAIAGLGAGAQAYLQVRIAAGSLSDTETESAMTGRISAFLRQAPLSAAGVTGIIAEIEEPAAVTERFTFGLVSFALGAKGAKVDLRVAFALPPGFVTRHGDVVKRLAIYADLLGVEDSPSWHSEAAWIATQALNKPLILKVAGARDSSASLAATMDAVESTVEMVWSEPADAAALAGLCAANATLNRFVTPALSALPAASVPFRLAADAAPTVRSQWFVSGNSADIVGIAATNTPPAQTRNLHLEGDNAGQFEIHWYDALTGARLQPGELSRSGARFSQSCACSAAFVLVSIHKLDEGELRSYTAIEVHGKADMTVEEVIARWQQYRETQKQKLLNFTADCFLNLHFESTNIGSGFDISMNFKQFANREGLIEWAQTEFFVNGVKFGKNREFPLPQLEPEKVMTQPLELKLDQKYDYKLAGTEQVNGVLSYVLEVEPKNSSETLYSGKVWIDGTTFRQVRQYLRQRGKEGNVISNVETQDFELISDGQGNQFNLLKSITAQQLLNAAGRDFVLQKTYRFDSYSINTSGFDGALAAAHHSDDPMFAETEQGLRSLRKQGDERVVEKTNQKVVRSLVVGMMYDGTFNFPIPIAGLSLADFNFRNTGDQLSVFFAGPILAANLSRPLGPKFRVGVDLAISGLPGNNRIYAGNTEMKDQGLWNWEEDTGLRATWQATTSLSLTASAYLSYEYYRDNSDTSKLYILPRNGITLMPSAELKYARKGYIFSAQATRGERLGWTQFGYASAPTPSSNAFTRYQGDFAKTVYIGKFTKAGCDFAYYGGDQLDRFSRYRPSFFSSPRINGLPGGTDSFDAVAIGSVNYGFNIMDLIKLEARYSYAKARNTDESRIFHKYDGLAMDFGTAGPFGTYFQGTVGYALDGNIQRYNSRWSAMIMIFKPLR